MSAEYFNSTTQVKISAEALANRSTSVVLLTFSNQNTTTQLRQTLLSLGFRHIINANNHYNGIERVRERTFDLIFFEAASSNIGAIEFVQTVKKLDEKTLLIAVSAEPRVDDVFGLLREGARHYLVLPFNVDAVEKVLHSAQEGPPFSDGVLNAKDRNVALAAVVMNSLDMLASGMRQARKFQSAKDELADRQRQYEEALELANMFCEGNHENLKNALIETCISRASKPSTRLGRTRRRLQKQRMEKDSATEEE